MPTSTLRRVCLLVALIFAVQVSIPSRTHAGPVADAVGQAANAVGNAVGQAANAVGQFVADHAAAITAGLLVGAGVALCATGLGAPLGAALIYGGVAAVGVGVGVDALFSGSAAPSGTGTGGTVTGGTVTGGTVTGGTVTGGTVTGGTVTGGTVTGGTVTGGTVTGGTVTGGTVPGTPPGGTTSGTSSGGGSLPSGSILNPWSRDADAGGVDTKNEQNKSTGERWGTQQTKNNTPFGKQQSWVSVSGPGVKGLEVPGFYAGTACDGSSEGVCQSWKNERSYNTARAGMDDMAFDSHGSPSGGGSASYGAEAAARPRGPGEYSPTVLPDGTSPRTLTIMPPPDDMDSHVVPLMPRQGMDAGEKKQRAAELFDLAMQKLNERDFEGAIDDLTGAIKLDPKNDKLYAYRAMGYNLIGNFEAAEKDALKAIELNGENEKAWESLAWAQLKQGKYKEAAESASRVLKLNAQNALAYAIRAFAREKLGDNKGKMEDIKAAASLDARYASLLKRGQNGQPIYDPKEDHSNLLLYRGHAPQRPPLPVRLILILVDMLLFVLVIGGTVHYRSLKKKGRVRDLKEYRVFLSQRIGKRLGLG
ncbi:MAG: tetratricopeptide repeat protein [Elusimicrobia bacterium]|nr:tetratricopeptide repeat protein [Elusimicrobiota bacterium]